MRTVGWVKKSISSMLLALKKNRNVTTPSGMSAQPQPRVTAFSRGPEKQKLLFLEGASKKGNGRGKNLSIYGGILRGGFCQL